MFHQITLLALARAAPDLFCVEMKTSLDQEPIAVQVNSTWAPRGSDRFHQLVQDQFYNDLAIFRVVPNFVMQFGISGDSTKNEKWKDEIKDDPVVQSNVKGTISFATAGPDTRTTQLFINFVDNPQLDARGFSPFGTVLSGFETALQVTNPTPGDRNGINQTDYSTKGNSWIRESYPDITFITKTTFITC